MKLSKRLEAAVGMVPKGKPAADIGCDHGYVSIELVRRGISPCAVASDVRRDPLGRAEKNIQEAGLSQQITTILCDGVPVCLEQIFAEKGFSGSSGTLIITGMGGLLILKILRSAGPGLLCFSDFILSPQSDQDAVRRELKSFGLRISEEKMILEDGKFYIMIHAVRGLQQPDMLREEEIFYGPVLLSRRDEVLKQYLDKRRRILSGILREIKEHGLMDEKCRDHPAEHEMEILQKAEEYYS